MILFFYGSNSYEARQQVAKLVAQYERKTGSNIGIERLEGKGVTVAKLRATLQAAPFLSTSRLVIVEGAGTNKALGPKIEDILADIPASTVAVFYDPSVDKRTVYAKALQAKADRVIEFKPLNQVQLQRWTTAYADRLGATIDRPALGRLLDMTGDDQWRIAGELTKLSQYNPHITTESVELLVEASPHDSVFALLEAVTSGRSNKGLELYRQLLDDGQSPLYILSMIVWQLRNLLLAKLAGRINAPQLAKQVGMSPFVAEKMLSKRHLFSESQLQQAFLLAVEAEYQIKTGAGSGEVMVERLILDIAQVVTTADRGAAGSARSR